MTAAQPVTIPATPDYAREPDGIPFVLTHAERSQAAVYRTQLERNRMNRGAYPTKGPGDVWPTGDTTGTYCEDDAHADIATQLHDAGDVAELVGDVIRARSALDWIALNVDLPRKHRTAMDLLSSQSRRLAERESEYGRLFCDGRKAA